MLMTSFNHFLSMIRGVYFWMAAGACFKALGGCSQLSTLNASGCTNLLYLQHLSKLQGLRSLNLSRCEKLQLGSLGWIGQLTGLTSLEATGLRNLAPLTPPEDSVNQSLEGWLSLLSKMQRLDLTGFTHPQGIPEGITNAISKMTALTELKMGDCVAPAWGPKETSSSATSDLSFLSPLVGLKHLDLSGWRHTNPEHLTALSSLDALQHLVSYVTCILTVGITAIVVECLKTGIVLHMCVHSFLLACASTAFMCHDRRTSAASATPGSTLPQPPALQAWNPCHAAHCMPAAIPV